MTDNFNESGSKYLRDIPANIDGKVDVYAVLDAFGVTCPARQHAIKKLLCSGLRGKASEQQDLKEARDAIDRSIQIYLSKSIPNATWPSSNPTNLYCPDTIGEIKSVESVGIAPDGSMKITCELEDQGPTNPKEFYEEWKKKNTEKA